MMNSRCFSLVLAIFFFFLLISPSFAHNTSQEAAPPPQPKSSEVPPFQSVSPPQPKSSEVPPFQSISPPQPKSSEVPSFQSIFNGSFSMVFAFGDSYTDTGNFPFIGNLSAIFPSTENSPYGSTTFGKLSNRLSDGCLIVDFLCESLGLPSPPPYKSNSSDFSHGVNFALAGATSLAPDSFAKIANNFLSKGAPTAMQTQIGWFNEFLTDFCKGKGKSECTAKMQNVLFWVGEIGITDYIRTLHSPITLRSLRELCLSDIHKLLKVLLESGAKYIVVQGLPPVGCLPSNIFATPHEHLSKLGCSVAVNAAIMIHNQILGRLLDVFRKQYPDAQILYANFWDAFMKIVMNPKKYHFTETFKACCGAAGNNLNFKVSSFCGSSGTSTCKDPSKYINWDGIHLTEAMYRQVTDLFLNQGFCQPSFDQLIKTLKKIG